MTATIWSLIPPILAIFFSLLTKEVNLSLLIGIIIGAGIYTGFDPFLIPITMFDIMSKKVYGNLGVIVFIILLGMIVHLMNLSGATYKYAEWASQKLKTKKQAAFATFILGLLIFVDDYFNCLTVGTVMRPITDRNRISREKLAYMIDSTAAPVCIIAPISSWAAAVSSSLPDGSSIDGFDLFIKSITNNFYAWFSLILIIATIVLSTDFGKMRHYEKKAETEGIHINPESETVSSKASFSEHARVFDLVLPVTFLIIFSIISMLYTGGFFQGTPLSEAFAGCDAILGLAMGASYTVLFLALLYLPRKIVTPKVFLNGLIEGFKNMVPATLILTFSWTLGGICSSDYLNAGGYVASFVERYSITLSLMPSLFFLIAALLAFSTGTSWGTFGILLPIVIEVFSDNLIPLTIISTAAVLGGSVCGDHISPISDTTILSSTGAGCNHINHASTQLQYGILIAGVTFICYMITGFTQNTWLGLGTGAAAIIVFVLAAKKYYQLNEHK